MKDKDLDKLFNDKLNSSSASFNEEAWGKAEQLLNKADDAAMDKLFNEKLADRSVPFDKSAWYNAKKLINAAGFGSRFAVYRSLSFYLSAASVAGLLYLGIITSADTIINDNTLPVDGNNNSTIIDENLNTPEQLNTSPISNSGIVNDVVETPVTPSTNKPIDPQSTIDHIEPNIAPEAIENTIESSTKTEAETVILNPTVATNSQEENTSIAAANINNTTLIKSELIEPKLAPSIINMAILDAKPIALYLPGPIYSNTSAPAKILPRHNKHYFGLIGGPTATKYVNGGRYKNSFFIGAHYARHLSSNWYLNTNLVYQKTEAQNISKEFKDISYGFGSSKKITTVTAQNLHYLELPIYATYQLSSRHSFDAGTYVSYLINASSKITEVNEKSFESTQVYTKTGWGLNDGINSFDAGIIVGYNYKVNDKLQLGGRLNYGLTDITNNDFYQNNSFDSHFQLRFVLDYKLFNK